MATPLTMADLNRATLARQMLLERHRISPREVVERLLGMQAQLARPPYVGLFTRIAGFERETLTAALEDRSIIRATLMRCTLHLMSAKDYRAFRTTLQPALSRAMTSTLTKRAGGLDIERANEVVQRALADGPQAFADLRKALEADEPKGDTRARAYAVRTHLPLAQVADGSAWGFPGRAKFTLAESWLEKPIAKKTQLPTFIRRYLAAFGPATPADMQIWSGLPSLAQAFDKLRPKLVTFEDEEGRELFDLPNAPRPGAATPAPVRLLPGFDNLVLAHADRRRVVDDAYRSSLCTKNLQVLPSFLIDGRVAGTWKLEGSKRAAKLTLSPFEKIAKSAKKSLRHEALAVARFAQPDSKAHEVAGVR